MDQPILRLVPHVDYRRECQSNTQSQGQKLWHYDESCEGYPARNFVVRQDKPHDSDLCFRCGNKRKG